MSQNQITNSPTPNWRDLRQQEREQRRAERREWRGESGWIFGGLLILIGVLLFLQNMNAVALNNWWALFILLPGFGSLASAWRMYQHHGGVSSGVVWSALVGVLLIGLSLAFVFNLYLDWTLLAPALLILLGVGVLLPSIFGRQ